MRDICGFMPKPLRTACGGAYVFICFMTYLLVAAPGTLVLIDVDILVVGGVDLDPAVYGEIG